VLARLAVLATLAACAPTYRLVTRRCPPLASELGDFGITATALALSAIAYNKGETARSIGYATFGLGLSLADNLSEGPCKR
jgi:hypothetical protein